MDTTENIRKVSLLFFVGVGGIHILSGLMLMNSYFPRASFLVHRTLDIPFILIATIYGLSNLKKILLPEGENKLLDYFFIGLTLAILAVVLYINLLIADRPLDFTTL